MPSVFSCRKFAASAVWMTTITMPRPSATRQSSRKILLSAPSLPPPPLLVPPLSSPQTLPAQETRDLCAAFQSVAFAHLEDRLTRAIGYLHDIRSPIRSLVVVGGVASNQQLREKLADIQTRANAELRLKAATVTTQKGWDVAFPPPALCTDNGVMVAWTGVELFQAGISHSFKEGEVEPIPRWPIGIPLAEEEKLRFRKRTKSLMSRRSMKA
jgi:N6-L-threonylcarbamoyladenine synthase